MHGLSSSFSWPFVIFPYNLCVICEEDNAFKLDLYSTKNAEESLRDMALEMSDDDISRMISIGDFVAIGLKYHDTCLTRYRNKCRVFLQAQWHNRYGQGPSIC